MGPERSERAPRRMPPGMEVVFRRERRRVVRVGGRDRVVEV